MLALIPFPGAHDTHAECEAHAYNAGCHERI